ncbi:MAG TPA: hypothetical protein VK791_06585, partial [bacterium]|nr:hypothetical protein [bacterium]
MRTPKTNRSFWFVLVLGCLTFYPVAGRSQTSTATADFFNHGVPASQGSSKLAQPSHGSQLEASTQVSSPSAITIDETTKSIRVDGYLVDWPVTRMILLNQKSQVTYGILNWKSKDDFSGRVFMTYDSQYLYLSAIVQKSSSVVNDNGGLSLWDGDCVELFLS